MATNRHLKEYYAKLAAHEQHVGNRLPPPPKHPKDGLGADIVLGKVYVRKRSGGVFVIVRPLRIKDGTRTRSDISQGYYRPLVCRVLWPTYKNNNFDRDQDPHDLFPLDLIELGQQWHTLTEFIRDYTEELEQ